MSEYDGRNRNHSHNHESKRTTNYESVQRGIRQPVYANSFIGDLEEESRLEEKMFAQVLSEDLTPEDEQRIDRVFQTGIHPVIANFYGATYDREVIWSAFATVILTRYGVPVAQALGDAEFDGLLPVGEAISNGLLSYYPEEIVKNWNEIWSEAEDVLVQLEPEAETKVKTPEQIEAESEIANEVIAGALMGDFNNDPTFWSDIGQIVTGLIPVAGQLGDIRDLVHILDEITNHEGYKKLGSWATLVLIAIGFIPGIGDAVAKLGKKGLRFLDNNRVVKNMGEFLGEKIIAPILNRVGDITAPVVGQIKDAIRRKLAEAQEIARQLGEGADNVIDNVTGRPQVATEGAGNVPSSVDNINQPMQMRGQGSGTYGTPEIVAELAKIPNANVFAPGQLEHVLFGNQNKRGRFTGWHHFPSRLPNERVRIKDFGAGGLVKDSNGVYKATAEASFDGGKTWVEKTAKDHTFFPNEWSKERVVDEISSAFREGRIKNKPDAPARYFKGISKSGVTIEGYIDSNGQITTAYPLFGQ